jgi:hypothetical protein
LRLNIGEDVSSEIFHDFLKVSVNLEDYVREKALDRMIASRYGVSVISPLGFRD